MASLCYNHFRNGRLSNVATKVVIVIVSIALIGLIVGAVMVLHGSESSSAKSSPSPSKAASSSPAAGLVITDETVGTGDVAVAGKTVTVNYTGTLADGTVFDSTTKEGGQPFSFALGGGQVIKGWDQGVVGMKVGGKRKLVIPPSLGYGAQGAGSTIPPNATLTFEIDLLSVK
jgi:FKBP-type peptidyl-prolyl cis-trans isomerase FkpA